MKLTSIYDTYTLNNGVKIPCVAFGTYKAAQGDNVEILKTAIERAVFKFASSISLMCGNCNVSRMERQSRLRSTEPREEF